MTYRLLKAIGVALFSYVVGIAVSIGYFVVKIADSLGPSAPSSFLSMVMSPGAYPIPLVVGVVAGILSYWKWK